MGRDIGNNKRLMWVVDLDGQLVCECFVWNGV